MLPDDLLGNQLSVVPKAVEKHMGHVYFENMIRDSEQATSNTVGIVIEYCDSSVFTTSYDPVKKNGSIPTSVHSYITANGITTIEETKETESGGKYIITTTAEKEQLVKDRLNNMFLDLQKCTHVVAIACMDRFKHYPFVRDHYTATGRTDKLAEKLKHKYQNGTSTNSFKSRSPVTQREDGTGFSIHSRQTCLPPPPIPTYVANNPNRPTKSILSTPRSYSSVTTANNTQKNAGCDNEVKSVTSVKTSKSAVSEMS